MLGDTISPAALIENNHQNQHRKLQLKCIQCYL